MTGDPILDGVGHTPLVELVHMRPKPGIRIFAKLEGQNPTGSVKDRIVKYMIEEAEQKGLLYPGMTIIEATTGNTGIALALMGKRKGYKIKVVVPENVVAEIRELLEVYGAEIIWVDGSRGAKGAIEKARELAQAHGYFMPDQFGNPANVRAHYETTGQEIIDALPEVDVFVAGLGTGGTMTGVGRRLKEHNPRVKLVAVEPHLGSQLQGLKSLKDGFIPPILDLSLLIAKYLVRGRDAFTWTRVLARREGVFAGVSSGAVLHGAMRWAHRMERGNIVVLFADGGWKYLSTGLWSKPPADEEALDDTLWW